MQLTDQHKAGLITFFISASVVMATFALHIKQKQAQIAETFYELEPEDPITKEQVEELERKVQELKEGVKAETNQAFNETKESNRFTQAYKAIEPPKDYEYTPPTDSDMNSEVTGEQSELYDKSNMVSKEESDKFKKLNDLLKKQQDNEANNARSTMSHSFKDRKLLNNPTPIYLCETGGKIVITVQINSAGEVVDAYVNSSSTTDNQCLEDNALEYAMKAIFSSDSSKKEQIGTITWVFQGKN